MEPFQHLPDHRIIVCKPCQIAVVPTHVETHLQRKHVRIDAVRRNSIVKKVRGISGIAQRPEDVQYPSTDTDPCELFPAKPDGLRCTATVNGTQCVHVCTAIWRMQRHCTKSHGWVNEQRRGGNVRRKPQQAPNRLWTEGQPYQQYFQAIGWKKYIPVSVERPDPGSSSTRERQRDEQAEMMFSQYEDSIREAKRQRSVEDGSNRLVANAWFSFTGWAGHLSTFTNKDQIQAYIQRADNNDDEERGLEDACRGTRRLIRAAFATSKPSMVSKAALESVNRRETGADTNERPLYAEQQVKTIRKYSDSWVHIL